VLWERSRLYLVMEYVQTDLLQYSRSMRGQLVMPIVKVLGPSPALAAIVSATDCTRRQRCCTITFSG